MEIAQVFLASPPSVAYACSPSPPSWYMYGRLAAGRCQQETRYKRECSGVNYLLLLLLLRPEKSLLFFPPSPLLCNWPLAASSLEKMSEKASLSFPRSPPPPPTFVIFGTGRPVLFHARSKIDPFAGRSDGRGIIFRSLARPVCPIRSQH